MQLISIDQDLKCFHCGDECDARPVHIENKSFCYSGCKSIYEILKSSDLAAYYELESSPGSSQTSDNYKFVYLDNPGIVQKLLDFSSRDLQKVTFYIPTIHCSSCIWLLEHLQRLHQGVLSSRVDLGVRELSVDYHPELLTLLKLVELLSAIGYEPSINLEGRTIQNTRNANRSLILGPHRYQRIDQIMSKKLFTVFEEDLIDLVPNIMKWNQMRHMLVENRQGELVGLVTLGRLGKYYAENKDQAPVNVKEVMVKNVITVNPDTKTLQAIRLMQKHRIGCLPVLNQDRKLVGVVTEKDLLQVAASYLAQ